MSGAVELGSFHGSLRYAGKGAHSHHHEDGVGAAGDDQRPAGADHAQAADVHVGRYGATVEHHGQHQGDGQHRRQLGLPAEHIAAQYVDHKAEQHLACHIHQGVGIAQENAAVTEYIAVTVQRGRTQGPEHHALMGQ